MYHSIRDFLPRGEESGHNFSGPSATDKRIRLPDQFLPLSRWEVPRSLFSSGIVNLQNRSISKNLPESGLPEGILTVVIKNSRLFSTGMGASSMPNVRAISFPESVCKKLYSNHVRSFVMDL